MTEGKIGWMIVAFYHPFKGKSVLYRQNIKTVDGLLKAVELAAAKGANLMSIRFVTEGLR